MRRTSSRPRFEIHRCVAAGAMGLLVVGFVAGCGVAQGGNPEVDRQEIEAMLRGYLPLLGQAYATQNPYLIKDFAVPKEMARINLRIEELDGMGQVYVPEFREVTVEDVSVWNYANAFVTTLELWDVRSRTVGSDLPVSESLGQRSRVKYQLKRKDDSWVVLYRELEQAFDQ